MLKVSEYFDHYFASKGKNKYALGILVYFLVFLFYYVDYITEGKFIFTLFYVILTIFVTRYLNITNAIIISVLASISTAYIDMTILQEDVFSPYYYFNITTRLIVYFVVIYLTYSVEKRELSLEEKIKTRTNDLQEEIKQRELKEHLLIESEAKHKNLLVNQPVALLRLNLATNKVDFANQEFIRQSGYDAEEYDNLTDDDYINMIHPDDRERLFKYYKEWAVNHYKGNVNISYRIINRFGNILWLNTFLYVDKDKSGNPTFINQLCVDISDQKLNEENLIKSKERYESFIKNSNEGIYRFEFDEPIDISQTDDEIIKQFFYKGYLAECNENFAKTYGYKSADEIIGIQVSRLMGDNLSDFNYLTLQNFINNNYSAYNEITEEYDKNWRKIYINNNSAGVVKDGKLIRVWGIQQNITELRESQDKIRILSWAVEQSPDAIIIMDTFFNIQYSNSKFSEISGYDNSEVINKKPFIMLINESPKELREEIVNTLNKDMIWTGEYLNRTKSGNKYWEFAIIAPIKNEHNQTTNYVYIKRDISDRKRFEEELIESRLKAEDANKIKSEFIANMSHEIRTPMNGILGMIQLLEMTTLDEEQKDLIDTIKYSSDLLLRIINDILDFSKLEFGNVKLNKEPFNMKEFGKNIYSMFEIASKNKGLDLELIYNSDFNYTLLGDTYRLNQILINLIGNSIKFTNEGFIKIYILEKNKTKKKLSVEFRVVDSGIGIPNEKFELLFESFTQLENTYTKKYTGTGLGLAIVKKLTDLMNGNVSIKSEVGKGSEFSIKFDFDILD
ncbi:MAG TPA: PAS domain S-box protein [Ignavibacteria bacterium]|nr:PAS domain S-box protein [Ignavibacteria bacterium]